MTAQRPTTFLWTGCYTSERGGTGTGIGSVTAGPDGTGPTGTALATPSPSFVAVHPTLPVVYAVGESDQTVGTFRRVGDAGLERMGSDHAAGEAACHVAVDPQGRFLVATCYGDGQVIVFELDDNGSISGRFVAAPSVDPHASGAGPEAEQRSSRAHSSLMLSDGRVMTTDLGHDQLRIWSYHPGRGLEQDAQVTLPLGSGPRHMVELPGGNVAVVSEYSIEVFIAARDHGHYALAFQGPATLEPAAKDDAAAEICLSPDGRFAYTGVRSSNRIGVLAVAADGLALTPVADVPSSGDWPRHHIVVEGLLLVAHERSNEITTFTLDPDTGLPTGAPQSVPSGSPTALILAG
ncbi:beta-propeller fold lactonase family protein [Pseudarthrobacter sp. PS3-L1]|uniref:lactonase family protein n=1 Tax=Pseudarthrobacter sp. PS3-L1 TaxID=3046207 RepID=UPI0024B8D070|nr:beta-propeller fold lactonase family protein [Pseudarthrobacter sp. PS3-L1]MDJ0320721.1 beta-propeller fold lactonase family protein [Pseudarthrobacter sp. PS3-L1]